MSILDYTFKLINEMYVLPEPKGRNNSMSSHKPISGSNSRSIQPRGGAPRAPVAPIAPTTQQAPSAPKSN